MPRRIKITINPKSMFGVSAKPGEITFGTHAHLNHYQPPKGLELRLLKAQEKMRKANIRVRKAPKNMSIKTMLAELEQIRSALALATTQRLALLSNYRELKELKERASTFEARKKYQRRAEREYAKVKEKEKLTKDARELETRLKEHLTVALSQEVKIKTKKPAITAKRELTQREREDADGLLDTKILYEKRIARIREEIKSGKLSTAELIGRRMSLKDAELSLDHTNYLLRNLTKPLQKKN